MIELTENGKLDFGKGIPYSGPDSRILSSHRELGTEYDVLIFTDSKGGTHTTAEWPTWTELVIERLEERGLTYLFICRPKEITIFFTLMNFLKGNAISFKYLVTNLGFVDFTPKKIEFMHDIIAQNPFPDNLQNLKFKVLGKYKLSDGQLADLYTFDYGDVESLIAREIESRFDYSLLLGCLEFSSEIKIERQRPPAFFEQLKRSNSFIFNIAQRSSSIHYIQPLKYQLPGLPLMSYDAVHFTEAGHSVNFEIIKPLVDSYIIGHSQRRGI